MVIVNEKGYIFISLQQIREFTGYELKTITSEHFVDAGEIFQCVKLQFNKQNQLMYVILTDSEGFNKPYKEIIYSCSEWLGLCNINKADFEGIGYTEQNEETVLKLTIKH